jgi:hypothetical protein
MIEKNNSPFFLQDYILDLYSILITMVSCKIISADYCPFFHHRMFHLLCCVGDIGQTTEFREREYDDIAR